MIASLITIRTVCQRSRQALDKECLLARINSNNQIESTPKKRWVILNLEYHLVTDERFFISKSDKKKTVYDTIIDFKLWVKRAKKKSKPDN